MKNLKILWSIAFLTVIIFAAGCAKDQLTPNPTPNPTPDTTPINPVITITGAPTDSIPFGDHVTFSYSIKNFVSATFNGSSTPASGTITTSRIINDSTFSIKAVGPNGGKADTSFTVKVKDWTSSDYGMISHDYWVVYAEAYKLDTMLDFVVTDSGSGVDPRVRDYEVFYYPNGVLTVKSKSGAFPPKSARWDIDRDTLEIFNVGLVGKYLIDSISPTEFASIRKSVYLLGDGTTIPCLYKTVYRHDE